MPSARRLRLLVVGVLAIVVMTLVYTSQIRAAEEHDTRTINDFWHNTVNGLNKVHGGGTQDQTVFGSDKGKGSSGNAKTNGKNEDDAQLARDMRARLEAAAQKAKDSANAKVLKPEKPAQVIGIGSSAGGQKSTDDNSDVDMATGTETQEEHEVETTINEILKKSPVIIFSKTYCPFSKRAKALLLEKYSITPEPYIVELDVHPLGKQIQEQLGKMTGRTTVPNIMINGRSIGGSDDIVALDKNSELVEKIRSLGSVGGKSVEMREQAH